MIAREGYPFLASSLVIVLAAVVLTGPIGWLLMVLPVFIAYFFRDPKRNPPQDPTVVVAPGDGKVIAVREVEEGRYLKRRMRRISIFLSIFDVHVNRVPCAGRVKGVFYQPGKFLIGFHEKASEQNEQNTILLEGRGGKELLFVQIAGWVARRIVCTLKAGDQVTPGERFGLIRFGSRVDLYLPPEFLVTVKVGDRVRGGETIMARCP